MAEDDFDRSDFENAILNGFVQKKLTHDPEVQDIVWKVLQMMVEQCIYYVDSKQSVI